MACTKGGQNGRNEWRQAFFFFVQFHFQNPGVNLIKLLALEGFFPLHKLDDKVVFDCTDHTSLNGHLPLSPR